MNLREAATGPPFDTVVIGGGINGCGIAAELARRGQRVALLEASDFGFGTTWRSTKLIHGGLRYLEHGDFGLVFESLRERKWLLKAKPHLVRPQRFILPVLPWTRRPAWQLRAGLAMYDILALRGGVPIHKHLGRDGALAEIPSLSGDTRDAFAFYDARARAPERLALELALLAERRGAVIANHTPVTAIHTSNGRVSSVTAGCGPDAVEIRANAVINAAGPWVDAVRNLTGDAAPDPLLGATRGSHIVVELDAPMPKDAIFSFAREDGRVFFAVPQDDLLLIGTTDVRFDLEPSAVRATADDVEYLLAEARALLPGLGIEREQVRYAYAGLRPLPRDTGGPAAAITRRHSLIDHSETGGPAGLFSIVGGKLSTFRPLAKEVAEAIGAPRGLTTSGHAKAPQPEPVRTDVTPRLSNYGPALSSVFERGGEVVCDSCGILAGEIGHAVEVEHASTLGDLILRRTGTGWTRDRGLCCIDRVADEVARARSWSRGERDEQVAAFRAEVAFHLPTLDDIAAEARP